MKKSKKKSNIIAFLVFIIGLSLVLYPTVSNMLNRRNASHMIKNYDQSLESLDESENTRLYEEAVEFNQKVVKNRFMNKLSEEELKQYNSLLDVTGSGMMGYVEIPSLDVKLPIYHGVDENVLQVATGHLEWSSLPVGGSSTHCVISGHRGLPSAKLFTDLDKLKEGDFFSFTVLGKTIWYEIDRILIVEPDDRDSLFVKKNMDYATLVTCTPYGINTHRLLVRGHRVTDVNLEKVLQVTADGAVISPVLIAVILFVPFSCIGLIFPLIISKKRKNR